MIGTNKETIYEALGREPVHPFPARMAPGIALEIISKAKRQLRVLDPMMGSGTVLAVARSKGHNVIGLDIDPLAVLLSKVWTTTADVAAVREKAKEVLERARKIFRTLAVADAYPSRADKETKDFVAYWFDGYARRQLASLSIAIRRVHNEVTRNVLWCSFSRLIITKQAGASLALDLPHSRPHRRFKRAPKKPFREFLIAVDRVAENCLDVKSRNRGPSPTIYLGDARALPLVNSSIDLVLTSPPYLNAIDYLRCSKFALVWMGRGVDEIRRIRAESVGTEVGTTEENTDTRRIIKKLRLRPKLSARHNAILTRYIDDVRQGLSEVARVLLPNGKAVYVIGENTIRGTYVRNSAIVAAAADLAGLNLYRRRERELPQNRRYLPPPSGRQAGLDTRMRREVIMAFKKRGRR